MSYATSKALETTASRTENHARSQLAPLDMRMPTMGLTKTTGFHILDTYLL
jgi:hypothetical protein